MEKHHDEILTSWVAGIVDGEGTISFQVYTMPNKNIRVTPFIAVVSTDEGILQASMEWFESAAAQNRFGKPRLCNQSMALNKVCKSIRVDGAGARPVIEAIRPYLRSEQKARNADVVLKFFDLRDTHLIQRDHLGRIKRDGYTQEELELVSSIRTHKRAKSLEEITSAPNCIG